MGVGAGEVLLEGIIGPEGVLEHDSGPAARETVGQEAFHDAYFQVDAVYEQTTGVAHRPVSAEDQAIGSESIPQKLERGHVRGWIGDGLEWGQAGRVSGHRDPAKLVDVRAFDSMAAITAAGLLARLPGTDTS